MRDMTRAQALALADKLTAKDRPLPLDFQTRLLDMGVDISIYQ